MTEIKSNFFIILSSGPRIGKIGATGVIAGFIGLSGDYSRRAAMISADYGSKNLRRGFSE